MQEHPQTSCLAVQVNLNDFLQKNAISLSHSQRTYSSPNVKEETANDFYPCS